MISMKVLAVVPCAAVVLACTSITVRPIDAAAQLEHVCIQENPKVLVSDFVSVLRDGLSRHGISSETFTGSAPEGCAFILTYTAFRSWDFAPYLSHAELSLESGGQEVACGEYHLRDEGGLSLMKWQRAKTKMDPVLDELLGAYRSAQ